jgi:hypothetical protein
MQMPAVENCSQSSAQLGGYVLYIRSSRNSRFDWPIRGRPWQHEQAFAKNAAKFSRPIRDPPIAALRHGGGPAHNREDSTIPEEKAHDRSFF